MRNPTDWRRMLKMLTVTRPTAPDPHSHDCPPAFHLIFIFDRVKFLKIRSGFLGFYRDNTGGSIFAKLLVLPGLAGGASVLLLEAERGRRRNLEPHFLGNWEPLPTLRGMAETSLRRPNICNNVGWYPAPRGLVRHGYRTDCRGQLAVVSTWDREHGTETK